MNPTTNIAIRAARSAGSVIMRYFGRTETLKITTKQTNDFVTDVDRAAEQAIIADIRAAYPGHAILAEESGETGQNEFQWIIDPLDGTTNYLHGFPQFAVSIALLHNRRLETAVVYDPVSDEMYTAERGSGAFLNDRRIRVTARKNLQGALLGTGIPFRDQRYIDAYLAMMKTLVKDTAGIRRPGSAALDFAYVASGRIDGFWELGLSTWDFAAGALLVKEAGGMVTDIRGGDRYLQSGNVVAGGMKVHHEMVRAIRPHVPDDMQA